MTRKIALLIALLLANSVFLLAQEQDPVVQAIIKEANENSQLEALGHELMDGIGPRLVGTPQMKKAHDWAVAKYAGWGITARNEQWGEWKGWERGISHIDMVYPRVQSLQGTQLAWSPATPKKGTTAELVVLPMVKDSMEFVKWLPTVKGKMVMVSKLEPTGRPDYNWEEFATEKSFEKMKKERDEQEKAWNDNMKNMGHNSRTLPEALEAAGAVGIVASYWSKGFGVNKIFSARTKKIPTVDLELEDYGMLYRLVESGQKPQIHVVAESKDLGVSPTFNTIAEIKGSEKPDEYVILSAHFDSWDGGTGATDNGTGTLVMMEAMRILKKVYPNPKRTILVGHWGSEEQGLNGSRAFVEDHPEIVDGVQALFNQDNGTGRVVSISGGGFLDAYDYLGKWLHPVPQEITDEIETTFPGTPARGGSDYASFQAAGAPAFSLSSLNWSYWNYTWHTNRDTYDKIIFDDVRNNAILTAILAYMASEHPEKTSRTKAVLPISNRTGEQLEWPTPRSPERKGGLD
ncbi:M20/M25/M40 family metallo-hydrolase [Flagellimonas taeanensis]|uniref:M20/M25/M40 family metallo-hydrolase n=1 Tax=Flavobacteriaceae TaxID=49546 RepID=UPI000E68EB5B|nr:MULTISPECIES: M20/M25/M40 family metallo-hydrolase [Allomuricauda]MDC6383887.1 M20/M25/M40 family metallo-hydrolase [Muricauda sp. SK9]MEE1961900.1 M20/M25/M40 family metallo-hydrolase [Allomuricauda taeanensis]RIV48505.1 M20/M25/M40 family metallo-hydrolase [Allomuricauda taeanensis]